MTQGIDYFNRGHFLTALQESVSLKARKQMYALAKNKLGVRAGMTAIDIGTTPDCERTDSNCMIPWLHRDGVAVTLSSPEDISSLKDVFDFAHILAPNGFHNPTLAKPREFDLATSSAVLEHCGERDYQKAYIKECARVADRIFLTTPNRWHWLEFHTKLPVLHWLPKKLHRSILKSLGFSFWAEKNNLNLLSRSDLESIAKEALGPDFEYRIHSIWTLGMPSNLILLATRRGVDA